MNQEKIGRFIKTLRKEKKLTQSELAHQKAFEIAKAQKAPCYVIGADTIVAFENRILGKPKDSADAVRMVSML